MFNAKQRMRAMHVLFTDEIDDCINTMKTVKDASADFLAARLNNSLEPGMNLSSQEYDIFVTYLTETMSIARKLNIHLLMNSLDRKFADAPSPSVPVYAPAHKWMNSGRGKALNSGRNLPVLGGSNFGDRGGSDFEYRRGSDFADRGGCDFADRRGSDFEKSFGTDLAEHGGSNFEKSCGSELELHGGSDLSEQSDFTFNTSSDLAMAIAMKSGSDLTEPAPGQILTRQQTSIELDINSMEKRSSDEDVFSGSLKSSIVTTFLQIYRNDVSWQELQNRFSYQRSDLGVYKVGDRARFTISSILDLQRLRFYITDVENIHARKVAQLSRKKHPQASDAFPEQYKIFGLVRNGCIYRAVIANAAEGATRFNEGKESVMFIDTGETSDITKGSTIYTLEPELQHLPGLAIPAELYIDPDKDLVDQQRLLITLKHEKVECLIKAVNCGVLQIKIVRSKIPPPEVLKALIKKRLASYHSQLKADAQNAATKKADTQDGTKTAHHEKKDIQSAYAQLEETKTADEDKKPAEAKDENIQPAEAKGENIQTTDAQDEDKILNDLLNVDDEDIQTAEAQNENIQTAEAQDETIKTAKAQVENIQTAEAQVEKAEKTTSPSKENPKPDESEKEKVEKKVEPKAETKSDTINITVLQVMDVDRVYAVIHDKEKKKEDFIWRPTEIPDCQKLHKMPGVSSIVLAKYVDGHWYRARVEEKIDKNLVRIFFVDYGNEEVVNLSDLAHCEEDVARRPFQAVVMRLADLRTATALRGKRMLGTNYLNNYLQEQTIDVKVVKRTKDLWIGFTGKTRTLIVDELRKIGVLETSKQVRP